MTVKVLDLFSGIGGFSLAAKWAGAETIAFSEVDDYASRVLEKNFPGVPNLGDVRALCRRVYDCEQGEDDEAICTLHREDFGDCPCVGTDQFVDENGSPDIITAGVPCQPASAVGKQRGADDERWLWPDTLRIIRELEPRFALMENPRALLALDGGGQFRGILGALADLGYDCMWQVVPAAAVGAGHLRERVWIVAANADCARLEGHARDGETAGRPQAVGHAPPRNFLSRKLDTPQWYRQSEIVPVVDGLPGRLARQQLTAVGNSVVPQVAYAMLEPLVRRCESC